MTTPTHDITLRISACGTFSYVVVYVILSVVTK
jgi:hypothetical protein